MTVAEKIALNKMMREEVEVDVRPGGEIAFDKYGELAEQFSWSMAGYETTEHDESQNAVKINLIRGSHSLNIIMDEVTGEFLYAEVTTALLSVNGVFEVLQQLGRQK